MLLAWAQSFHHFVSYQMKFRAKKNLFPNKEQHTHAYCADVREAYHCEYFAVLENRIVGVILFEQSSKQ